MNDIAPRIALVTGACGGIGSAVTRALLDGGATVVATDLSPREDRHIAPDSGNRCLLRELDVADETAWSRVIGEVEERFGRLDVLVNNAGTVRPSPLHSTSLEDYNRVVAVNQTGVFLGMRAALPLMMRRGSGLRITAQAPLPRVQRHSPEVAAVRRGEFGLERGRGNHQHGAGGVREAVAGHRGADEAAQRGAGSRADHEEIFRIACGVHEGRARGSPYRAALEGDTGLHYTEGRIEDLAESFDGRGTALGQGIGPEAVAASEFAAR